MLAYRHIKKGQIAKLLTGALLMMLLDPRYTQVGFNLISVQVCCTDVILVVLGVFYPWAMAAAAANCLNFDYGGKLRPERPDCPEAHLNRGTIESNLSVPGIQGCHENALIKSFETSPHLICF